MSFITTIDRLGTLIGCGCAPLLSLLPMGRRNALMVMFLVVDGLNSRTSVLGQSPLTAPIGVVVPAVWKYNSVGDAVVSSAIAMKVGSFVQLSSTDAYANSG